MQANLKELKSKMKNEDWTFLAITNKYTINLTFKSKGKSTYIKHKDN